MRLRTTVVSLVRLVCLLGVLVAFERSALAQSKAPDRSPAGQASALKRKADAEMDLLHYADALESYAAAYELTHDPALQYNRARVLEALERYSEALEALERFSNEASPELRARVPKLKELMADMSSRLTKLTVNCTVPNARVLVRDKQVATTPVSGPIRINAGQADLEVIAEGYLPYRKRIDLPKGGELAVDVTLAARDAKGQLVVASTPIGADVRIDGNALGRAPAEAQLAPGNHVILLSLDGYRDSKTSAVVVEGERKRLDVTLEANPRLTERWWFWTGIGVVVVGATVATLVYALTTERSAGHGDIPPGQVAGPLRF